MTILKTCKPPIQEVDCSREECPMVCKNVAPCERMQERKIEIPMKFERTKNHGDSEGLSRFPVVVTFEHEEEYREGDINDSWRQPEVPTDEEVLEAMSHHRRGQPRRTLAGYFLLSKKGIIEYDKVHREEPREHEKRLGWKKQLHQIAKKYAITTNYFK